MSTNDIRVGDLVMVVKPTVCCGNPGSIGMTSTVRWIDHSVSVCMYCGEARKVVRASLTNGSNGDASRLKKINPPAHESGTVRELEEQT